MASEILLLRGLFRGSYHWGSFPQALQNSFPQHRITCIEIPGNGELFSQASPNSITGMVESVRHQRGTQSKVNILCVSMGGMIGLKWAELYPQEINSLICVNSSTKGFSPFYERLLPRNYFKILRAMVSSSYQREKIIYEITSNKKASPHIVAEWDRYSQSHPMKLMNFMRQLYAANTFQVSRPQCSLFFVAAKKDRLVSYRASKAMAEAWDVPIIINDFDGHDVALDNPSWLINVASSVWGSEEDA